MRFDDVWYCCGAYAAYESRLLEYSLRNPAFHFTNPLFIYWQWIFCFQHLYLKKPPCCSLDIHENIQYSCYSVGLWFHSTVHTCFDLSTILDHFFYVSMWKCNNTLNQVFECVLSYLCIHTFFTHQQPISWKTLITAFVSTTSIFGLSVNELY